MHPPLFTLTQHLSDWPDCNLEICCRCGRSSHPAIKLLIREIGDYTFQALLPRLICKTCRQPAAPVYLVAGLSRVHCGAGTPAWSLELVAVPPAIQKLYECDVLPLPSRQQKAAER